MKKLVLISAAAALFAAAPLFAKEAAKVAPVAVKAVSNQLTVNGDSTLHGWHSDAKVVSITAESSQAGDLMAAIKAGKLSKLELSAEVTSLHSPEGKGMDKNTWKTLEADKFPDITFSMASYTVKGDTVTAKGILNIHGIGLEASLDGALSMKDGGAVNVKGSYPMKMTQFGIKPPVMMLGTIKVKDELTIAYDFDLVP